MAALSALPAACSSTAKPSGVPGTTTSAPVTGTAGSSGAARSDAAGTVWLCRPALADDPCAGDIDATAVGADGSTTVQP
ncbi:MAG TPA: hypothetical protein VMF60_08470, partial [Acidimicrobiales bacterium]|nr:hypothetical protein [Acidimicrobiales bacterium]